MVPGFDGVEGSFCTGLFSQDDLGGCGPDEGPGFSVVVIEVVADGLLEELCRPSAVEDR